MARCRLEKRPHRLTARTAPFHGVNRGSIPRGVTLNNMKKSILITGVAGSGKSTLSQYLREQGYSAYDIETIPDLFETVSKETGRSIAGYDNDDLEKVVEAQWMCNRERLQKIIADEKAVLSFYCGTASNLEDLLDLFSKIFILITNEPNTRSRLTKRTSHDFGKKKEVQDWIFTWKDWWENEMKERGAIPIDSNGTIQNTAESILNQTEKVT